MNCPNGCGPCSTSQVGNTITWYCSKCGSSGTTFARVCARKASKIRFVRWHR